MKKICWEESFHILHGRDVILTMMNGTDEQRELVQEALNRWWGPLMQFHGNPIPAEDDPMYIWRIKSQGNEEARQQFLDGYVPQIWELGLTVPDPKLRKDDDGVWEYTEPDWDELQARRHRPRPDDRRSGSGFRRALARARPAWVRARRARRSGVIYEVFRQERKGQPFQHAGSVEAPDATFAEAYAREQYGRRGESVALWVVPREAVLEIDDFVDELDRELPPGRRLLAEGEAEGGA